MSWLRTFVGWLSKPFQPPALTPDAVLTGAESAGAAEPPARGRRWVRVLLWVLHVLLVIAVVVVLWYLNRVFDLDRALRVPWRPLSAVWLPALFLLFYALCWLGWWLWRLLGPEKPSGEFADIEAAWAGAVRMLRAAGIEVADVPLFVVLGRPAAPLEQFFAASRLPLQVRHAPGGEAPLHVYANREAIYVTCEGASLLGRQVELLTELPPEALREPHAVATVEVPLAPLFGAPPEVPGGGTDLAPAPAAVAVAEPGPELVGKGVLLLGEVAPSSRPRRVARPPLLKNATEVKRQTARLRHLCKLLVRDRQPYCPVNGVLVLLPLAATDSADDASQTGAVCRHDLAVMRGALQVDCPRWAVLCDFERVPGFCDLVQRHPEGRGADKTSPALVLGRHFPLAPVDAPAGEWPVMVESGVTWLADNLLPLVVYKMLGAEANLGVNVRLFGLLAEGRERLHRLGRLLSRGLLPEGKAPLFGGCYLAATGADANREQAFLAGVFRRALEGQNFVAWAPEALAEDADYRRWAVLGYGAVVVFVAVLVGLMVSWAR